MPNAKPMKQRDSLDRVQLVGTLERLQQRLDDRFPGSSLRGVCAKLVEVAKNIDDDLAFIRQPKLSLRLTVLGLVALVTSAFIYGAVTIELSTGRLTFVELLQIAEAGINDLVLIGAAIIFMISFEVRAKRQRVIAAVNRLRSIAHVIDMHQLTKDPSLVLIGSVPTAHSPPREMSAAALGRYLDYCSEMLALTSKIGFCYVQDFDDTEAVHAINELENLCSGLSAKVWQKIMLIQRET